MCRPMRIAFVYDAIYPWVSGGAERRNHELARRLAVRHDVHLIGWQWWDGPATIERDGVVLHGVGRPPQLYGSDGKRTVREALAFSARVLPILLRNRWDVVDCSATPYLPVYPTWLATRLTGTRLVVTWHEFWGEHWTDYLPDRPLVARLARALESAARRLGDRLVAVSAFTARTMAMADAPRLSVVPNGVDVGAIAATAPVEDGADLLYLGRLIDEKRVELVLEAIALAVADAPELRCDIVGDGPRRSALERPPAGWGSATGSASWDTSRRTRCWAGCARRGSCCSRRRGRATPWRLPKRRLPAWCRSSPAGLSPPRPTWCRRSRRPGGRTDRRRRWPRRSCRCCPTRVGCAGSRRLPVAPAPRATGGSGPSRWSASMRTRSRPGHAADRWGAWNGSDRPIAGLGCSFPCRGAVSKAGRSPRDRGDVQALDTLPGGYGRGSGAPIRCQLRFNRRSG